LKKLLFSLLLFVVSSLVGLLMGEGIIRLLYKDKIVLFPRYFTDRWVGSYHLRRMRPSMEFTHRSVDGTFHFITNREGFRNNQEIPYQKRKGEVRVLVLGDSHTFGYEVNQDETYAAVAQKLLREKGLNATVINAGLSGTGTAEQLVFFEQVGYRYQPDFVVIGFFSNDFDDNTKAGFYGIQQDTLVIQKKEHVPGIALQNFIYQFSTIHWLSEHSYLYNFAFNTVWDFFKNRSLEKGRSTTAESVLGASQAIDQPATQLETLLVQRFYQLTRGKSSLILLDVPTYNGLSSVPPSLVPAFRVSADTFFQWTKTGLTLKNGKPTHVPHGQRHISATTHALFGEMIATYIAAQHR
jgi:hypothetical protein